MNRSLMLGDFKVELFSCVSDELTTAAIKSNNFVKWCNKMIPEVTNQNIVISKITIQSVDKDVEFIKFVADIKDGITGLPVPGIVFMRGSRVAILIILKVQNDNGDYDKYVVLAVQRRVPIGDMEFDEIPVGLMDGRRFLGAAIKEVKEEIYFEIAPHNCIDLNIACATDSHSISGIATSPDGSDETIRFFLHEVEKTKEEMELLQGRLTGNLEEGESITLKIIPYESIQYLNDSKALCAAFLYERFLKNKGR